MARARLGRWSKILEGSESVPPEDLEEDELVDEQKRAKKWNDEAYNVLILCCEGSAFNCVERAVTERLPHGDAALAWKNLKEQYADAQLVDRIELRRQFNSRILKTGETPDNYIDDLVYLQGRLREAGTEIGSDEMITQVLFGLPQSYSEVTTILTIQHGETTLNEVRKALRAFYRRNLEQKNNNSREKTQDTALTVPQRNPRGNNQPNRFTGKCFKCGKTGHRAADCRSTKSKCFKCGKPGHFSRDCPQRQQSEANVVRETDINETEACLQSAWSSTACGSTQWIVDTGASRHMTPNKSILQNLRNEKGEVRVGDGSVLRYWQVGDVYTEKNGRRLKIIGNVALIPKLTSNLLSLGEITKSHRVTINATQITIHLTQNNKVIAKKTPRNLYIWEGPPGVKHTCQLVTTPSLLEWHQRAGHPSISLTEKYAKENNLLHEMRSFDCVSCKLAKAKRKKVPRKTETRAGKPGERLFIDLSGPFSHSSYGGSQYAMVIVDDFSRYKWTKFLKAKNEAGKKLKELLQELKGKQQSTKYIRCDNAGENTAENESKKRATESIVQVARTWGIEMELTAPHTPKQNGVAERAIALIEERATALLEDGSFTEKQRDRLWAEGMNTATRLLNQTPSLANPDAQTPNTRYMVERETVPDNNLRVFGQTGYVTIPKKQPKFQVKSVQCFFVGYARQHASDVYRMLNPQTGKIFESRNVGWSPPQKTIEIEMALGGRYEHRNEVAQSNTKFGESRCTNTEHQVHGRERNGARQQSASVRTNRLRDNSQKATEVPGEISSMFLCWIRETACIRRVSHAQSTDWKDFREPKCRVVATTEDD